MRYLILVVLYKKNIKDAKTIISLINSKTSLYESDILVWDNGLKKQENKDISYVEERIEAKSLIYKHTPENIPLSKLYNNVIREFKGKYDYVVLFDHDSVFDRIFFQKHQEAILNFDKANLYLPNIRFKDKIVSPAKFYWIKGVLYTKAISGIIESNHKTAINSGMIISANYFFKVFNGYDKRLKYYGTDDFFMIYYAKLNDFFVVIDYIIEHELTYSKDSDDLDAFCMRHKDAKKAYLINYGSKYLIIILKTYLFIKDIFYTLKFRKNFFR